MNNQNEGVNMENEKNIIGAGRGAARRAPKTVETNNMCDYCSQQDLCDCENKNNVACGYFTGKKMVVA